MGHLIRVWTKSPLPTGAKIGRSGTVTWTVKGKKRTGKLSENDKVSHQVDTWSAEFTDETGKYDDSPLGQKTAVRRNRFLPGMKQRLPASSPALLPVKN